MRRGRGIAGSSGRGQGDESGPCGRCAQGQRPGVGKEGYVNGGVGRAWGRRARGVLGISVQTRRGGVWRAHACSLSGDGRTGVLRCRLGQGRRAHIGNVCSNAHGASGSMPYSRTHYTSIAVVPGEPVVHLSQARRARAHKQLADELHCTPRLLLQHHLHPAASHTVP